MTGVSFPAVVTVSVAALVVAVPMPFTAASWYIRPFRSAVAPVMASAAS